MDERTAEILKRFRESWTATEDFIDHLLCIPDFERLKPVRQFMNELKQDGGENFFRLGTSIHMLVISRSVNQGLRKDQKWIRIEAFDSDFEVIFRDGDNIYRKYIVTDLRDIRVTKLLQTLKSTLVD
jgi:hypothetical protein